MSEDKRQWPIQFQQCQKTITHYTTDSISTMGKIGQIMYTMVHTLHSTH